MKKTRPCTLIILDGWGIAPQSKGNAVKLANTPYLDTLFVNYPHTQLLCSGKEVGLPPGIMGNSEVGHLNIGAGRIIYQDLLRIDRAIADGSFYENKVLNTVINKVKSHSSSLHLMGLLSDGGVHSRFSHLMALLELAKKKGLSNVYIHVILDGRDTPPDSGIMYIKKLQKHLSKIGIGKIATICGRYYAMDRDNRWDRISRAFDLYIKGKGRQELDPVKAVEKSYQNKEFDEFVQPIIINSSGILKDNDGVIFFNFRSDRAREITRALTDPQFEDFDRDYLPDLCEYVCMTLYSENFSLPIVFSRVHLENILGKVVSDHGLKQLRIAETEKYAHVTYFFNGGEEKFFDREDRCLIPSPKEVATYDLKPEMSALLLVKELQKRLKTTDYDMIIVNFANMDMVGHTGKLSAAIKACETVDKCLSIIIPELQAKGGSVLITADHGNAECMEDENGKPFTAHTTNPVPLLLIDESLKNRSLISGKLGDIAPTMLDLMGIPKPKQMTGESLLSVSE